MSVAPSSQQPSESARYSLKHRALLFLSTLFLLFFFLLAFLLQSSFERSLASAMQDNLTLQVRLLLADIEVESGELSVLAVQESALNKPESHLKAYIFEGSSAAPVWMSLSAASQAESLAGIMFDRMAQGVMQGEPRFEALQDGFALAYRAVFALEEAGLITEGQALDNPLQELDVSLPYTVVVFDDGKSFRQQVAVFQRTMIVGLAVALIIFMVLLYVVLRALFSPLAKVESQLLGVESGELKAFSDDYPQELNGLTSRLNQFINSERKQRERYKNTLADLAHSFKTPISAIKASVSRQEPGRDEITLEQLARMEQIVAHQLRRGQFPSMKGQGYRADCVAVIQRLLPALKKIYSSKPIALSVSLPEHSIVAMPEDELLELLGNLLDNAFKYAEARVTIEIIGDDSPQAGSDASLAATQIAIGNDGQLFSPEQFNDALQRGKRLDEAGEGHGIGLSVAYAVTKAYGGQLLLNSPGAAGAQLHLILPKVSES